jgi:hypothetical protein
VLHGFIVELPHKSASRTIRSPKPSRAPGTTSRTPSHPSGSSAGRPTTTSSANESSTPSTRRRREGRRPAARMDGGRAVRDQGHARVGALREIRAGRVPA